VLSHG